MGVFVIAEAGSSHDNDILKAFRLIEAAKECGADAVKFQWTSSGDKLRARRKLDDAEGRIRKMYQTYLEKPVSWLESLKAHADKVGIEFMCTVYLIEDIATIAPLVKLFKVSAMESQWREFISAHCRYEKAIVISVNPGQRQLSFCQDSNFLHCISKYPCPVEELQLRHVKGGIGLSDHTTSVNTGAQAVARNAPIIEKHIRLWSTDNSNPDYGHSLDADKESTFAEYVANIREAEKAL